MGWEPDQTVPGINMDTINKNRKAQLYEALNKQPHGEYDRLKKALDGVKCYICLDVGCVYKDREGVSFFKKDNS